MKFFRLDRSKDQNMLSKGHCLDGDFDLLCGYKRLLLRTGIMMS